MATIRTVRLLQRREAKVPRGLKFLVLSGICQSRVIRMDHLVPSTLVHPSSNRRVTAVGRILPSRL